MLRTQRGGHEPWQHHAAGVRSSERLVHSKWRMTLGSANSGRQSAKRHQPRLVGDVSSSLSEQIDQSCKAGSVESFVPM